MFKLRWPHSEPIKSQRELEKFHNLSLVSVIYYGDSKKDASYKSFYHSIPHFSHSHQRFGHVFQWELKKKFAAKLPCIEVKSHIHEEPNSGLLCQNLTESKIKSIIEGFVPDSHKVFHHGLSSHWFNPQKRTALVFMHKGINTDEDRYKHRVFHQFFHKHNFEERIGEVNVARVDFLLLETGIKAC